MFIEKLSAEDKQLIDAMRRMGVDYSNDFFEGSFCPTEYFLRIWDENKAKEMSSVFGNDLILKRKINIVMEDDQLHSTICDKFIWDSDWQKLVAAIKVFLGSRNDIDNMFSDDRSSPFYKFSYDMIFRSCLFSTDALISNRYNGPSMEVKVAEGKVFKFVNGAKVMKIIGRLSRMAGMDKLFEDIRIRHSQVLNEARISSNLCLSIHPMDYMTASYNNNDWRSCMHWEDGEYRRGVIEMMNSPYVVVAYLESNHNNLLFYESGEKYNWNSKKWREFFIVHPLIISGIKGYPYWNRELENLALSWLKDLFTPVFKSITFSKDIMSWHSRRDILDTEENITTNFNMECGPAMYNDFYSGNEYHSYIAKNLTKPISINYSGPSECVVCGGVESRYDSEESLACDDCLHVYTCSVCGESIYTYNNFCKYNGRIYCSYCYSSLPECTICRKVFDPDNDGDGLEFTLGAGSSEIKDILFFEREDEVINPSRRHPLTACVCEDCAPDIFIDGSEEINKRHAIFDSWYADRVEVVPITSMTEEGLKLFPSDAIKYFRERYSSKIAS